MVKLKTFSRRVAFGLLTSAFLLGILFFQGCYNSGSVPVITNSDNKIEFSLTELAAEVEKSVVQLNYLAVYKQYRFSLEDEISEADLQNKKKIKQFKPDYIRQPSSGTATVIASRRDELTLVSTLHIVDYPKLIIHRFPESDFIKTYSIMDDYTLKFSKIEEERVEEIARDNINDLVLYRVKTIEHELVKTWMRFADNSLIKMGSEAFVLGYPLGNKLLTSAIITPSKYNDSILLLDANFNHGFSGGLVFGFLDNSSHPQILGLATSTSASYLNLLVPDSDLNEIDLLEDEYSGTVRVKKEEKLNYGVTMVVSGEVVQEFVQKSLDD